MKNLEAAREPMTLRDCPEPKEWRKLTHDPSETIRVKRVTVDCFRDGTAGAYYERFTYPGGRVRWLRLEEDRP